MNLAEGIQRRQLDHGFESSFEQYRQDDEVVRSRVSESGADADIIVRHIRQQHALFFQRHLPDNAFAHGVLRVLVFALDVCVGSDQVQLGIHELLVFLQDVEQTVLRRNDRCQLRKDLLGHGIELFLSLKHLGELCQVGFQPVLLLVEERGLF